MKTCMTMMSSIFRAFTFAMLVASVAVAEEENIRIATVDAHGVALNGYDVVAYFSNEDAVLGTAIHSVEYGGLTWYFSSERNKVRFENTPEQYLPEYDGFCAYGVSQGYLVKSDPRAWSIHNGKLYLNFNFSVRSLWLGKRDKFIRHSEQNWPVLSE